MSKRVSRRSRKSRRGNLMLAKPTTVEGLEPRLLMSAAPHGGYWLLRGTSGDDTIVVQEDPADASQLQAWRNGDLLATANKSAVRVLRINGGRGDDQITVNLPAEDNIKCVLEGGAGNDTLVGSDGRDVLFGGIGRDNLSGGAGDDVLWGGTGNDILDGGAGDDRLYGGAGDDVLKDPEGVDLFNPGRGKDIVYGDAGEDKFQTSKTDLRMGAGSQSAPLLGETAGDLRDRLIQQALEQNQNLFGQAYQNYWWPICYACDGLAKGGALSFSGPVASLAAASGVTSQATDHSNTNTQVAGVDEADIVENDGNYLYVISGQELLILKAWPADQTQIVSRTPLGGYGAAMYLDGDRLTVITNTGFSSGGGGGWWWGGPIRIMPLMAVTSNIVMGDEPPIYVQDDGDGSPHDPIVPYWWQSQVQVTVLDVSDRTAPLAVEQTVYTGSLTDSRAIGDRVYLVLQNPLDLPGPIANWNEQAQAYYYETADEYAQRMTQEIDQYLPHYTISADFSGTGQEVTGSLIGSDGVYSSDEGDQQSMTSLVLMKDGDTTSEPVATSGIYDAQGQVYASENSLYIVGESWRSWLAGRDARTSGIFKFGLGVDSVPLEATGSVPGWIVNQFAMDEYDGFLRIATTSWSGAATNSVFVLGQTGDQMDIVSGLTDLGLGETIQSVRFLGDRGFLTTFKRVDPMFSLDLSDPYQPRLAGQLEIPGFSSYLHPLGSDYLIGLGYDADPTTGRTQGMQLSLFDVSDLSNPQRIATYTYDTNGWTWTQAQWDHLAFSYFDQYGVLALPVERWSSIDWTNDSGVDVFQIDPTSGIQLQGHISQGGWVNRNVQIGPYIYSISSDTVKVSSITDLSPVAEVPLLAAP